MSYSLTVVICESIGSHTRLVKHDCDSFEDVLLHLRHLEDEYFILDVLCVSYPFHAKEV